jgi:hypothetical protein
MSNGGSAVTSNSDAILSPGVTSSNSVFLGFSVAADIWPNLGLPRE